MPALIVMAVLLLAYSNGANDNFKGVATLFGSGTTNYGRALAWATLTTLAGSLLALVLAHGLVDSFKGKGLLPDVVTLQPAFLLAVSLGAGLTVLLATLTGLPVSTTHALTGGLIGAGLLATAGEIKLSSLLSSYLLPLLCSPVLAMLLTLVIYPAFRVGRRAFGITSQSCVCVGSVYEPVRAQPDGSLALVRTGVVVQAGQISECVQRYQGRMLGLDAATVLDALHYLSAGAVGFARGLNDTPKIVALLLAAEVLAPNLNLTMVAVFMALGGVLNARRVAETMSRKISCMNPGQGLTANLVTSLLVVLASRFGLPVSTTHVSVGTLFGIGAVNGTARKGVVFAILLAWVTTLPLGALFAGSAYWMLRGVG
jgi:inorganic phosphate transporter, PiT family